MYENLDGSPRYGIRTLEPTPSAAEPSSAASPIYIIRYAAGLDRIALAAAIDSRLRQSWADEDDPLLVRLRADHRNELREARRFVKSVLGTNSKWLDTSAAHFYVNLAPVITRRRAAGRTASATVERLGLFVLLILPPLLLVIGGASLALLLASGIVSSILAVVLGETITARLRLPVAPVIRKPWLQELRRDIEDATLLALLQAKGIEVDPDTAKAAMRGWEHLKAEA